MRDFTTKAQIEYAKSIVIRQVTNAIHEDLKDMEFDHPPRGAFGIGISMMVKRDGSHPIRYYREKQLETEVVCDKCTLRFAIYGVFGWCPDCSAHNSARSWARTWNWRRRNSLSRIRGEGPGRLLTGDALENVVSAFDGFGREVCERKGAEIRFQSLVGARNAYRKSSDRPGERSLHRGLGKRLPRLQKRHLLAHKMGVIDEDYVQKANDPGAIVGRKVRVTADEVGAAMTIIETLGKTLYLGVLGTAV